MEILVNNGHSVADEVDNVGLSDICQVDNGSLSANHIAFGAGMIEDPSGLCLEDESMILNTKKRAFNEESKDLQSPSKKHAVRSSSDTLAAEVDSVLFSSSLAEAMIIDTTWEETGERDSDDQPILRSFEQTSGSITACTSISYVSEEAGIHVNSGVPRICETAQGCPNLQITDVSLVSVDSNADIAKREENSIALNSAQLEIKDMEGIDGLSDSTGLMEEDDIVEKEDDPLILQNLLKNGHVIFETDEQVATNATVEERAAVVIGMERSVLETGMDGGLLCSSRSGVESGKTVGEFHVASASPISTNELSASETQTTPLSLGSHSGQACQVMRVSAVADGALRCETVDEEVVGDESGISEVDELQVEKVDAAKAFELKMVEVIMQGPGFEVAESRNDETLNSLSDDSLRLREQEDGNRGKDIMKDLSDEDKFTELFEPVVQLPLHSLGSNGFLQGTLNTEDLSNGLVSDDLHLQQEIHANVQLMRSRGLRDPRGVHVAPNKGLDPRLLSGSVKGDDSMDMQDSEIATPSAATSTQSQSSSLKLRLSMKGQGEIAMRELPNFAVGRGFPVKELFLKEAPTSAKLLLASGLLDGHYVRYLGRGGHVMLTGIIKEGGVLCDCSTCKGVQVVNVSAFEKHAGSSARHPSDFIFLENGKCLKDILEIGWNANKQKMNIMDVLKSAIGEIGGENIKIRIQEHPLILNQPVEKNPGLFLDTKPRLPFDTKTRSPLDTRARLPLDIKPRLQHDMKPRLQHDMKPRLQHDIKPRSTIEMKPRGSEGRATLPRDRTARDKETASPPVLSREISGANLHKALFLPGGLEDGTELGYYVKGQKFLAGVKSGAGISCGCCEQVISCSLFEQHAGWGSRRNPYTSIYLADGRSLHDAAQSLVVEQTVKQEGLTATKIEHLDQCAECGDSGDLQLCTGCPNAYHQDCLGPTDSSTDEFFCPDCQEQRFGGTKDRHRSVAKRRSKGASKTLLTKDRVTGRCTRLLQGPEAIVLGGCVFCKSGDFVKSGFGPMTTMLCDQCEREYHVGCLKKQGLEDLKEVPEGEWFCGQDCKHIHSILSLLVANGPEPLADSIISKVLKRQTRLDRSEEPVESSIGTFEWQLLHGRGGDSTNGKTLAEAVQIFSECFDPIMDRTSGRDLIPPMVYRRSTRDQDFRGIYCVVLKQDNKVVSTALVRVFGRQLAELPLLATNPAHQGQGHCKALLLSIERLLGVLRVERLALPAADGAEGIWLNKFDFTRMPEDQVKQFHTNLNMMIFTGSFMLEKEIPPLEITGSRKA